MTEMPAPTPWVELVAHYPGGEDLPCRIDGQPWPCRAEGDARERKLDAVMERGRLGRDANFGRGFEEGRARGVAAIVETWNELERRFPEGSHISLAVAHDPEGGHDELWLRVGTYDLSVEAQRTLIDAFDEEYWLDRAATAGFSVGFDFLLPPSERTAS